MAEAEALPNLIMLVLVLVCDSASDFFITAGSLPANGLCFITEMLSSKARAQAEPEKIEWQKQRLCQTSLC
jgi:hypothetical protein